MEESFRKIIEAIGEDPNREGLVRTPERAAKAFEFLTQGYRENIDELINQAVFTSDTDEMVIVRNIELYSLCEHHLLPFIGKCHVAYLPAGKVLGLSKIARIVDFFARRLQIQEVLTKQIAECVNNAIEGKGVGVIIEAQHMCMMMRGVEKQNSVMTTSCMLGHFRSQMETRNEEIDPAHSHLDIMLRFARVNGANLDKVRAGHGLPTTRAWVAWVDWVAMNQSWYAAIAATKVASESQSPRLYSKLLPALRKKYKFKELDIEHFWLHSEVDVAHGGDAFRLLEKHCTTRAMKEEAIHWAREGARMRWFHFDGIYLHYEMGYSLT